MSAPDKPIRLERRLTRNMILVQAVVLLLFFSVIALPLAVYPALRYLGPNKPLDPANTTIFAEAIRANANGTGRVEMTPRLDELVREHPRAWFYATTASGTKISGKTAGSGNLMLLAGHGVNVTTDVGALTGGLQNNPTMTGVLAVGQHRQACSKSLTPTRSRWAAA